MLHEMGIETGIDLDGAAGVLARGARGPRPAAGQPHAGGRAGGVERLERLRADIAALAAMPRGSASAGERRLGGVDPRPPEVDGHEGEVEGYRGRGTYAWAYALLARGPAGVVVAAAHRVARGLCGPRRARGRRVGAGDGARRDLRRRQRRRAGSGQRGRGCGPSCWSAHHDTQRTGLVWHPALHSPGAARRLRTRSIPPYLPPAGLAVVATARGRRRVLAGAVRRPVDRAGAAGGGARGQRQRDRRRRRCWRWRERFAAEPLSGVEVLAVFPGGEESGMQGMRAFLRASVSTRRPRSSCAWTRWAAGVRSCCAPSTRCCATATPSADLALVPDDGRALVDRRLDRRTRRPSSPACGRSRSSPIGPRGLSRTTTAPTTCPSTWTSPASAPASTSRSPDRAAFAAGGEPRRPILPSGAMRPPGQEVERIIGAIAAGGHGVATRTELLAAGVEPRPDQTAPADADSLLREWPGVYRVGHRAPSLHADLPRRRVGLRRRCCTQRAGCRPSAWGSSEGGHRRRRRSRP